MNNQTEISQALVEEFLNDICIESYDCITRNVYK